MAGRGGAPVRYVALLRGIAPVNPNMRNERLRAVFEGLGFEHVRTVVASGNVVFDGPPRPPAEIEAEAEAAWPAQLGFTSTTLVRTADELRAFAARRPFGDRPDTPDARLHVTFLKHEPAVAVELPHEGDGYCVVSVADRAICSVLDQSGTRTPGLMRWVERVFGPASTTRSWGTVQRILRLL